MERLEKYAWMQKIKPLHAPIQILMCGVSWVFLFNLKKSPSFILSSYVIIKLLYYTNLYLFMNFICLILFMNFRLTFMVPTACALFPQNWYFYMSNISNIIFLFSFYFYLILSDIPQSHQGVYFAALGARKLWIAEEELRSQWNTEVFVF